MEPAQEPKRNQIVIKQKGHKMTQNQQAVAYGIKELENLLERTPILWYSQVIEFLQQSKRIQNIKSGSILKQARRMGCIQIQGNIVSKTGEIDPICEVLPWMYSFWVVLSFMPESAAFITMQYPFTYSFHVRGKLIEVAYFPDGKEEVINDSIKRLPIDTKETVRRIAVLENQKGIKWINETGFTHFCYVVPGEEGICMAETIPLGQAWKEEPMF